MSDPVTTPTPELENAVHSARQAVSRLSVTLDLLRPYFDRLDTAAEADRRRYEEDLGILRRTIEWHRKRDSEHSGEVIALKKQIEELPGVKRELAEAKDKIARLQSALGGLMPPASPAQVRR